MQGTNETPSNNRWKNYTMRESIKCAAIGIWTAFKTDKKFSYYLIIILFSLLINISIGVSSTLIILNIIMGVISITVEMLNTAVEHIANLTTLESNIEIKMAKDMAAGAVLMTGIAYFSVEAYIICLTILQ